MIQYVFLLEDDEDDRKLFSEALKMISPQIHITSFSNGVEALQYLTTALIKPDIIFSDINMPLLNGFEFIKEINTMESYQKVPIVLLSTLDVSHHPSYENLGPIPFYSKPSNFRELCRIIEEVLTRYDNNTNEEDYS